MQSKVEPLPTILPLWQSYLTLCKPRVVALMLLTTIAGMQLASPAWIPFPILFFATLGIGCSASCGAIINHLVDQRIDGMMSRTQRRPLPTGAVSTHSALWFAALMESPEFRF